MSPRVEARRGRVSRPAAVALIALAAVAWWLSVRRMQGMDTGPGVALGALRWFTATWLLMMAAMMLPAITPAVSAECFPKGTRLRSPRPVCVGAVYIASYLAVWALAGVAVYLLLAAGDAVAGNAFAWHQGGRWLASAVLATAAGYQLTATKRRWLARCRAPLLRPGAEPVGELGQGARAGLRAGGLCVASSWALMAVLFALGAMSLVWMAVVAALIAAERLAPFASAARIAAAGVLLALAVGVAAAPASVPGLTLPGSPAAERSMMQMGGTSKGMPTGGARAPMSSQPDRTMPY